MAECGLGRGGGAAWAARRLPAMRACLAGGPGVRGRWGRLPERGQTHGPRDVRQARAGEASMACGA